MNWLCPQCRSGYDRRSEPCERDGATLVPDLGGASIGGCTIDELIGARLGGAVASSIWSATRAGDDDPLTVLIIEAEDGDRDALASALRDASVVRHPRLATIHRHGETPQGWLYLITDAVGGPTLAEAMALGALEPERALSIARDCADGVMAAHEGGLSHAGLEPEQVRLVGDADEVVVWGFGVGRRTEPAPLVGGERPVDDTALPYRAPELIVTGDGGPAADVYAIGAMLFQMLAGRPPFPGSPAEIERGHLSRMRPRLSAIAPGLADVEALQAIVDGALAKRPEDRIELGALRQAIAALAPSRGPAPGVIAPASVDRSIDAAPAAPPPAIIETPAAVESIDTPPRRPPPPVVPIPPSEPSGPTRWPIAVGVLALVGAVVWYLMQPGQTGTPDPVSDPGTTVARSAPDAAPPPVDARPVDAAVRDAAPAEPDAAVADAAIVRTLGALATQPPGATITLADGTVLGTTPWSGILPATVRALTLTRPGFGPIDVELTAAQARAGGWKLSFKMNRLKSGGPTAAERAARQAALQRAAAERARLEAEMAQEKEKAARDAAERARKEAAAAAAAAAAGDKKTPAIRTLGDSDPNAGPKGDGPRVKVLGD